MGALADKLESLSRKHRERWVVEMEPHNYSDGTTHFTHVGYDAKDAAGNPIKVRVADYVTPELGELLELMHNNVDEIISALRKT